MGRGGVSKIERIRVTQLMEAPPPSTHPEKPKKNRKKLLLWSMKNDQSNHSEPVSQN
jgi:hypothetical protein